MRMNGGYIPEMCGGYIPEMKSVLDRLSAKNRLLVGNFPDTKRPNGLSFYGIRITFMMTNIIYLNRIWHLLKNDKR
jgi:hypothetical protein